MIFLMIFYDFTMSEKKREIFRYDFFMIFLWLNLWFFYEIYDLVSLGFEEKSRKNTKKIIIKKSLKNHKNIIKNH